MTQLIRLSALLLLCSAATLTGRWKASVAGTGKSTYTGVFVFADPKDGVLTGEMQLSKPLGVTAPLKGEMRGDTAVVTGAYSNANGCIGTLEARIVVSEAKVAGPMLLHDKCVGDLPSVVTLTRE